MKKFFLFLLLFALPAFGETAGGRPTTATNVGTGVGQVFKDKNGNVLELKTIRAGANITVTNNASDITIAASGSTGVTGPVSSVVGDIATFGDTVGGTLTDPGILASALFFKDGSRTATGAFNMGAFKITNLATPTVSSDAATKGYVDGLAGGGTVTSVGLSLPGIFTVNGSPVTTSGTLTGTLATQIANQVFAGPTTGVATMPTFRSLVGADLPSPSATTLGGVESFTAVTHQWINAISIGGVPSASQPAFSDISGTVAAAQLPNPSATTLGGIESYAAVTHQWVDSISTAGVPHSSQPTFTDISGTASTGQIPDLSGTYLALAGGTLTGDVKKSNCYITPKESDLGNSGATLAVDLSTATVFTTTLTASATITFSNPVAGCAYALVLTQDATGSRIVTWAGTTALWGAAGTKTLSTAASSVDKINCVYDGASTKLLCDLATSYQ